MKKMSFLLALACLAGGCSDLLNSPIPEAEPRPAAGFSAILDAANAMRAEARTCGDVHFDPAPPLVWDGRLERAARSHTADMSVHTHFDHVGTDGSTVGDRVSRAGYDWQRVGENLARTDLAAEGIVALWAESPGHCANLMQPGFTEMGSAEASGYWTQVLGRPR